MYFREGYPTTYEQQLVQNLERAIYDIIRAGMSVHTLTNTTMMIKNDREKFRMDIEWKNKG